MNDDILYRLLPLIYRQRDAKQGYPLQAFMRVLESQFTLLRQDIDALYDNWFIETCDDWVVPYIADLLQVDDMHGHREGLPSHRTLVANTLTHRSGKGTLRALARAAQEISGWQVHAALGADALALTQSMAFVRAGRLGCADLRRCGAQDAASAGAARATYLPRSVEVRLPRVESGASQHGRFHLLGVTLYLCRLQSYPVANANAFQIAPGCYTFHPLGVDQPLFSPPHSGRADDEADTATRLPLPLQAAQLRAAPTAVGRDDPDGPASFRIAMAGAAPGRAPAPPTIADLSRWAFPAGAVLAVDPALGRIMTEPGTPAPDLRVWYNYGLSADLGGGPYPRSAMPQPQGQPAWVGELNRAAPVPGDGNYTSLAAALADWRSAGVADGLLRITDSSTYCWGEHGAGQLTLPDGARLTIESASGVTPSIMGDLAVTTGGLFGTLALSGLWCRGRLFASGAPTLLLSHCTWLPGGQPSLSGSGPCPGLRASFEQCITGPITFDGDDVQVTLADCIVDAAGASAISGVALTLQRSTVLGDVAADIELIGDSLVTGRVAARDTATSRQPGQQPNLPTGQVRFSYVAASQRAGAMRKPAFTSRRYGHPGYCQLSAQCSPEIRRGAENGSEMGAFHQLSQHWREAYLRRVIDEYLPHSMHAGIFFLS